MASKRIMKKRAISKAAEQAQSLTAEQLLVEINRLQEKNKQLMAQLQQAKQQDVQNQKQIGKLRGQIQVVGAQLKMMSQANTKLTIKAGRAIAQVMRLRRNSRSGFGKQVKVKRTHKEYLAEVKSTFIDRFAARIAAEFGIRNADEQYKLDKICEVLASKDVDSLDLLLQASDPVREAYYESSVYGLAEVGSLDFIYDIIVGQKEDNSEIAQYEVEYVEESK